MNGLASNEFLKELMDIEPGKIPPNEWQHMNERDRLLSRIYGFIAAGQKQAARIRVLEYKMKNCREQLIVIRDENMNPSVATMVSDAIEDLDL